MAIDSTLSTQTTTTSSDDFAPRHLGPRRHEYASMLGLLGVASIDQLLERVVPSSIRWNGSFDLQPKGEQSCLEELRELADENVVARSYIGLGYYDSITPTVILRNVLENPGWYTQYTAYQAEISQGRLEALLNFQTMVLDLTGMEVANSSLLDEGTAAAEAMTLAHRVLKTQSNRFFVDANTHPQTIAVIQTRAEPLDIEVVVGNVSDADLTGVFGVLVSYPGSDGDIPNLTPLCARIHDAGALAIVATDLLALTLVKSPGSCGADIVIGSSQRFGVPLGFGGPHAAFLAGKDEYKRQLPGRIVGVSVDAMGKPALRLALQTREQHIRRDKATSNICTAQVLLAVVASMYAVYHGPEGLTAIAKRVRGLTHALAVGLEQLGYEVSNGTYFDTLTVRGGPRTPAEIHACALDAGINLRNSSGDAIGVSLDETVDTGDVRDIFECFGGAAMELDVEKLAASVPEYSAGTKRDDEFLTHEVFHRYRSETEMLRYLKRLENKDLSLTSAMIPLGSCTMKLNATTEMIPISWPGFAHLHPFVPPEQAKGYAKLHARLEDWLSQLTGFAGCSLQPNAGSQGEYAGLLVIRAYHHARGDTQRKICVIPSSAHGTNPASATLAGMKVSVVKCDDDGNIDLDDLQAKCAAAGKELAALMVTYPSTHGVFEETIRKACAIVHEHGGQVYLDGANMNALVGVCRPGDLGADVCHLNLHKTFCIPHGGGGPGMGPICVAEQLLPFLPGHPLVETGGDKAIGAVSAAPWGSPSILPISYAYIRMMGGVGLYEATAVAILNANYIAKRLEDHYPVLYKSKDGWVAHECILDTRHFDKAHITVDDIAKRLIDYGFHAPTMSWPVSGTLMVEPTESESKQELDRFCDAMIAIRNEIREIEAGKADATDNVLKRAPHTAEVVSSDTWDRPYSRHKAAFPVASLKDGKYWPSVSRVDNVYGDRNLVCICPPLEDYAE
ncbi:MAG: aminomethyl-transferring glycine dehydrogenase [Planctomycetes bacterium]|nr:aminomethyl-transferring glycine dehydrogenase [Planctomycetota bacterium]MCB9920256.1 aminomethyl-transferring glycine dehydrogenase [Planctomycetota bacterium]